MGLGPVFGLAFVTGPPSGPPGHHLHHPHHLHPLHDTAPAVELRRSRHGREWASRRHLEALEQRENRHQRPTLTQPRDAGWADEAFGSAVRQSCRIPLSQPSRPGRKLASNAFKLEPRGIVLPEDNRLGNNREIETSLHATIARMTFSAPRRRARQPAHSTIVREQSCLAEAIVVLCRALSTNRR